MSSVAFMAIVMTILVLSVWHVPHSLLPQTASEYDALDTAPQPSLPVADETFSDPRPVQWDGYVSRVLVGGEGLEIVSHNAPGGIFQAYMPVGQVAPVTQGPVYVEGVWRGYTCAYGGRGGGCVPEVDIQSIQAAPIQLEH